MRSIPCTLLLLAPVTAAASNLLWEGDFETGDMSQYRQQLDGAGTYTQATLVTDPVRFGSHAVLLEVLGNERPVKERAELITAGALPLGGVARFLWDGPEYWIGFSFRVKDWQATAWTFFQVHSPDNPHYPEGCATGGNAFTVHPVDNQLALSVIEDGEVVPTRTNAFHGTKQVWAEPLVSDVWYDFVARLRLSTQGEGFAEVWRNGEKIYSKFGMTNVLKYTICGQLQTEVLPADKHYHYGTKIGIYSDNTPQYRGIYYDEVRFAEGPGGFDVVAPPPLPMVPPRNLQLFTK